MDFKLKVLYGDDKEYPDEILIQDDAGLVGTYRRPLRLDIIETKKLFDTLKPIMEKYVEWQKKQAEKV